jgi:hypothetical protein
LLKIKLTEKMRPTVVEDIAEDMIGDIGGIAEGMMIADIAEDMIGDIGGIAEGMMIGGIGMVR